MHNTTTFCRILLWIVLVLVCAVQIMTIVSIQINNANAIEGEAYDKVLSIVPLIVAAVLLLGGAVLFEVFPKRGYIGLILCAVAGIIFFIYAFSIRDAFPVHIGSDGKDTGVTTARMIWRHRSSGFSSGRWPRKNLRRNRILTSLAAPCSRTKTAAPPRPGG